MKPSYRITIFAVEDNAMYSLALDMTLKNSFNYRIINFESAEKCLENLHLKPNIIILDYMLGGMNGHQALIKIKQALPNAYVIILSQQKEVEIAVELVKAGAYKYIAKSDNGLKKLEEAINDVRNDIEKKHKGILPS